jgi:hypothetical protein
LNKKTPIFGGENTFKIITTVLGRIVGKIATLCTCFMIAQDFRKSNQEASVAVNASVSLLQGCQIFLAPNIPKRKNIPNDHKLYPKTVNYTKCP